MPSGSAKTVEILQTLRSNIINPSVIDGRVQDGSFYNGLLVMTSMGRAKRALITPYNTVIQWEARLRHRLDWAATRRRPLAEAVIGYDPARAVSQLTLRVTEEPEKRMLESRWEFPTPQAGQTGALEAITTWHVADAMVRYARFSLPVPHQSGWVDLTDARLAAGNWQISEACSPIDVVHGIHSQVARMSFVKP